MKVVEMKLDKIIPYARNPRINAAAIDKVAASLKEFKLRQPIVVDSDNVIIVGHTRLLAAQKLGLKTFPVHVADDLTEEQVKAYRIADNKTAELSEWDDELLLLELDQLDEQMKKITGFTEEELENLGGTDEDLQEIINSETEYMDTYDQADKRAKRISEQILKIKNETPDLLNKASMIILDGKKGSECLILIDDAMTDIISELKRYADQGVESPLAALMNDKVRL